MTKRKRTETFKTWDGEMEHGFDVELLPGETREQARLRLQQTVDEVARSIGQSSGNVLDTMITLRGDKGSAVFEENVEAARRDMAKAILGEDLIERAEQLWAKVTKMHVAERLAEHAPRPTGVDLRQVAIPYANRQVRVGQLWDRKASGVQHRVSEVRDRFASLGSWTMNLNDRGECDDERFRYSGEGDAVATKRTVVAVGQTWQLDGGAHFVVKAIVAASWGAWRMADCAREDNGELTPGMMTIQSDGAPRDPCWRLVSEAPKPIGHAPAGATPSRAPVVGVTLDGVELPAASWSNHPSDAMPPPGSTVARIEPSPSPRCGQTWRHDSPHKEWQGMTATLYDFNGGLFHARLSNGLRITQNSYAFSCYWTFVSGPTQPETPQEAFERVVRLEAADVPEGISADRWLGELVRYCAGFGERRTPATDDVRRDAARLRTHHVEKWTAWAADRTSDPRAGR